MYYSGMKSRNNTTKPTIQRVYVQLVDGIDRTKTKTVTIYGKTIAQIMAELKVSK